MTKAQKQESAIAILSVQPLVLNAWTQIMMAMLGFLAQYSSEQAVKAIGFLANTVTVRVIEESEPQRLCSNEYNNTQIYSLRRPATYRKSSPG
jgi:hypothetical protein